MKPASIEELTEVITTAQFHPLECSLFALGTSKGYVKLCDMRAAALCDRNAKVFRKEDDGGAHSFFSELISSISDLTFSHDGRYFVTRDYMNMKLWDLNMESQPVLVVPVHDTIKPKLCDLYENDSIFDKFECSFNHDSTQVVSGSYSNFLRVTSIKDQSSEAIQADKSIFRSKKTSKTKLSTNNSKSSSHLDDVSAADLDFDRKILHLSMHPRENTVAIAALSNLFIFSQMNPI